MSCGREGYKFPSLEMTVDRRVFSLACSARHPLAVCCYIEQSQAFSTLHKPSCLQEGSVVKSGKHSDLMQDSGVYAQMWNRQAESSKQGMSANPSAQSLAPDL